MGRAGGIRLRLIALALFGALPFVALGIYRLSATASSERRVVTEEVQRSVAIAAARIDERLQAGDALLTGLAVTLRADPARRLENEAVLRRTLASAPSHVANLFLLDTAGTLVATARTVGPSGDSVRAFANRGYFNIVRRERGLVVGEIRRSVVLTDEPWVVVLARAITDIDGRFTGVVSMPVRLDSLVNVTRGSTTLGTPLVTIYDTAGVILARSEAPDSVVGERRFPSGMRIDTTGVALIPGVDGLVRLTAFTRTRSAPWMVNLGTSQSDLEVRLSRRLREEIALLVLAMSLAVLMALFLGQRITQPLAALVEAARGFERGETVARAVTSGPGEIRLLGNAFNQMAETVERRSAALADSERRYRFLFDSNPLPMWAWDADTMQVMAVNEAAIEKYGYDRERFLGLRITDLLDPSEVDRFSQARLPFSENRQSAGIWMHRTASGRQVDMEIVTASSRRLGRASWLSVGIDITARREAERALARSEEQLRQVQKMEAIGTFAGGISHDFNNLLTGMLGYCDLALSTLPPDSDAYADVSEVRALAVRGSDLTRQILTVSRKQVVQPTQFDPNDVVVGLERLLRRVLGAHIELETHLSTDIGTMRADASQLEQVLLNLTANARDAMPTGGTLRVITRVVGADAAAGQRMPSGNSWILITVSDTGIGMPPEVRDRIFEPFFTTKDRGKGTGLGLALAYAMVEQAGGIIRVESEPGFGTTFSLYFPRLVGETQTADVPSASMRSVAGSETILLAEDEDSVRAVATAALERHGYRVLAAPDGDTAIAIAEAFPERIDLLLTDVVMPGKGGRELAEILRRLRPGIHVIFASGYTDDESLLGDVRADERMFLQKPFTSAELVKRVRRALDQTAIIGPR
jgi:two-component system cell cycle sensor histidine kinase/response regulator CckA